MTDPKPLTAAPALDGRDEMNLADFPISVLDSRQPTRIDGGKVDTVVYEASRYDPLTKRRSPQRVTLLTNSQIGLPTPTDENVVLGLLCLAKRASNFESPRVHFTPHALMTVLRWAPTGKNYRRLRDSLRRLKALTIRYENAWWDKDGREYQSEFATGIVAEYFLATQVRGRRRADAVPETFVVFSPRFYESLQKGNLKRLDLNTLFALKLPTSQRMYRFLDKRFYGSPAFEMDLVEFACGHVGMTPTDNVAHLKQRLDPPIRELQGIGFLSPSEPPERYRTVAPKVWRVRFQKGTGVIPPADLTARTQIATPPPVAVPDMRDRTPEEHLVRLFYVTRFGSEPLAVTAKELQLAKELIARSGRAGAVLVVETVADILKTAWPEAKTFLAVPRYLADAEAKLTKDAKRVAMLQRVAEQSEQDRKRLVAEAKQQALIRPHWEGLSEGERDRIRARVLARQPKSLERRPALLERLCLLELARLPIGPPANPAVGPSTR